MRKPAYILLIAAVLLNGAIAARAAERAPWGSAEVLDTRYQPAKVLYDLTSGDREHLSTLLDRVGHLFKLYGSDTFDSAIVVVVHGDAVPLFAIDELEKNRDLMTRARSLTVGTSIEFRMCSAAARLSGYEAKDIHGFVKMVPMADAEIARLQQAGYAYLR